MANPMVIVSSLYLQEALRHVDCRKPVRFELQKDVPQDPSRILTRTLVISGEVRDWKPFELKPNQMYKLWAILDELEDQPLTLEYDVAHEWLVIRHMVI